MTWFVASIVSYFEVIGESQSEFPIYEDFYLFEANSKVELDNKIKETMQGINAAGTSGINFDGKPAIQKCAGVRKIRSVYNEPPLDMDQDRPGDGTELTHSFLIASSLKDVELYAQGAAVSLLCVDDAAV
ncbi:MAG: hypothetical protein PHU14_10720 [Methylovulum sp.]|nr:hypothetical protein [Methylovulum sp.]